MKHTWWKKIQIIVLLMFLATIFTFTGGYQHAQSRATFNRFVPVFS